MCRSRGTGATTSRQSRTSGSSRCGSPSKERELDPALVALRRCVAEARGDRTVHPVARERLENMLAFTELMDRWYAQMLAVPKERLAAVFRMGARVLDLLPLGRTK